MQAYMIRWSCIKRKQKIKSNSNLLSEAKRKNTKAYNAYSFQRDSQTLVSANLSLNLKSIRREKRYQETIVQHR